MTIQDILDKYDDDEYYQIELTYEEYDDYIETFESKWEVPDCILDEEATGKLVNRTLKIKIKE